MWKKINDALDWSGEKITAIVGTMWCAIAFALLAFVSLPAALATRDVVAIIGWIAQTFLQLVLLSVIMVGQDLGSRATNKQIAETHKATMAEFAMAKEDRKRNADELAALRAITEALHLQVVGKSFEGHSHQAVATASEPATTTGGPSASVVTS